MKKIIIIPDVHGRTFWKEPVYKYRNVEDVHIVFLGDYLDAYKDIDGIEPEDAIANFEEILEVARSSNNITLLIGNHDLHYWPEFLDYWGCRRYNTYKHDISKIFLDNIDLFSVAFETYINDKQYLFTHAGVVKNWYDYISSKKNIGAEVNPTYFNDIYSKYIGYEDPAGEMQNIYTRENLDMLLSLELNAKDLNKLLHNTLGRVLLQATPRSRGGREMYGSCIWADIDEHYWTITRFDKEKIYQIFSHSLAFPSIDDYVINDEFAMLDCRKAFELDCENGEITLYKNGTS
jgi:hypothetical protein